MSGGGSIQYGSVALSSSPRLQRGCHDDRVEEARTLLPHHLTTSEPAVPTASSFWNSFHESIHSISSARFRLSPHASLLTTDRLESVGYGNHKASVTDEIANMTKNIIGGGVLSLSGGMALFASDPVGATVSAAAWIVILGAVFGYFCWL